jgi:hypothetical protein
MSNRNAPTTFALCQTGERPLQVDLREVLHAIVYGLRGCPWPYLPHRIVSLDC